MMAIKTFAKAENHNIYSREQKFKTTQLFKRKISVLSTNRFKIISICLTITLLI